jgi:hypothetical protein
MEAPVTSALEEYPALVSRAFGILLISAVTLDKAEGIDRFGHRESPASNRETLVSRLILSLIACLFYGGLALAEPLHGIAMHGTPALPPGFSHFPYVNPDVKKGGRLHFGVVGTFNNLNPFIVKARKT